LYFDNLKNMLCLCKTYSCYFSLWDYSLQHYVLEGGGRRPFPKFHKFLPNRTISNICRVCFIKPLFTLV